MTEEKQVKQITIKSLLKAIPERILELLIKLISVKGFIFLYFAIIAIITKDESDITYAFIMAIIFIGAREITKFKDIFKELLSLRSKS
jgi:hypothetical protein